MRIPSLPHTMSTCTHLTDTSLRGGFLFPILFFFHPLRQLALSSSSSPPLLFRARRTHTKIQCWGRVSLAKPTHHTHRTYHHHRQHWKTCSYALLVGKCASPAQLALMLSPLLLPVKEGYTASSHPSYSCLSVRRIPDK